MKTKSLFTLCFIILHSAFCLSAGAQSTAFTYQGRLFSGTNAASGNYDLAFSLFDASNGGTLQATPITNSVSGVSNGLFTVTLDFGASVFPGADRWLEITTRTNGAAAFTTLTPRQKITSAPYAVRSINASTAASAVSLSGTLPASQLTGTVPLAQLPGAVVTNNASGVVLNGTFTGNGAGVTNVQLTTLNSFGAITWPGNFTPGSTLPVGSAPRSVVAADVNGDGWPDLISANTGVNSLTVLTNNRSGGFGSNATYTVGAGPLMVATADVNGDGKVDLLSVNTTTVIVLTNNGAGGFGSNATISVGTFARSIAVADINHDGWPDFIIANFTSATLRVFTNNGAGGFGSNAVLTVGSQPFVMAADVNGDGWPDLVTANTAGNSVSILLNSGGTFGTATTLPLGGGPTVYSPVWIAAADLNGDGKLDLITANSADSSLSLLLNNGSGSFTVAGTVPVGSSPRSVVARDVNGDGKVDLISANSGANTLTVLTNDGSGGFALAGTAGTGSQPWSLATADLNGDGRPDLISANSGDNTLTVLFNTPVFTGSFAGNGAGLTSLNPGSLTSGTVTSALTFNNAANSFIGNGGGLTSLNASNLASGTVPAAALGNAWQTAGNAGANPANGAFLGTSDNLPLELRVNGARALRLEPNTTSANVIGGYSGNVVSNGVVGATIAGGGETLFENRVGANFATVGGGDGNVSSAGRATISGGFQNNSSGGNATVGGGSQNNSSGGWATVPGGRQNTAGGQYSFAAGRRAQATNDGSFVWADSTDADFGSTSNDQFLIRAQGGVGIGTNNPQTALHVVGTVTADRFIATAADPPINVIPVLGMVWIKPGTFIMGSPTSDPDSSDDERPQTVVTLTKGFWMGVHEVTQGEYQTVNGSNPSGFTGDLNRPVEQVSWNDATNYCAHLTQTERSAGRVPVGWGYRLPTEAEWEYACRAGARTTRFSYGDDLSHAALGNYAWYGGNSGGTTHPVEQKLANPWGLMDMHGNVWEWCQDGYGSYPGGSVTDPTGPGPGTTRVMRGGSSGDSYVSNCRSAARYGLYHPTDKFNYIGFRVVLAPGQP